MRLSKKLLKEAERLTLISNQYGYWSKEIQEASKDIPQNFGIDASHLIHSMVKKDTTNLGGNL